MRGGRKCLIYLPFPFSARFVMAKELKLEDDLSIFPPSTTEESIKDHNITLDSYTNKNNAFNEISV